jgi:Protein of unknown function (DUF3027)
MRENNWVSFSTIADFALEVLLESVPADHVGQPIDVLAEYSKDPQVSLQSHTFECKAPAYPGWYWAVTVVSIDGQTEKTVSEINLLPGSSALIPQSWKPWAERVQAGDLEVGDVLPTDENDKRLTAGFTGFDELEENVKPLHPNQWELGLGREQVLSTEGLELAVDRWYSGDKGPRSAMAKSAPANCSTCGFLTPIGGSIGQVFGVCANEFGAADGQIVAMSFGCGAHSSVRAEDRTPVPVVGLVIDDVSDELEDGTSIVDFQEIEDSESDRNLYDHNLDADLADEDEDENFHEAAIIDAIEAIEEE